MNRLLLIAAFVVLIVSRAFAFEVRLNDECLYLDNVVQGAPHVAVTCGIQPGESKFVPAATVQNVLGRNGVKMRFTENVTAVRSGVEITVEEISSRLQEMYAAEYPGVRIVLERVSAGARIFTASAGTFELVSPEMKLGTTYVTVKTAEKEYRLYAMVRGYQEGFVTTDRVAKGGELSGKAERQEVEITSLKSPLVTDVDSVIATRSIGRGRVLTEDLVTARPDKPKGAEVTIVYSTGGIVIRTSGVLEEDAFVNRVVRVKNSASGTIVRGTYQKGGTVQVK